MYNFSFLLFFFSFLSYNFGYEETHELCEGWNQMKCWSIGCVKIADKCNGKRDCADGSDETISLCKSMPCRDEEFKCDYGACVSGKSKCNGTIECWDSSDEKPENCVYTPYCVIDILDNCISSLICFYTQPYNGSRKLMADDCLKNRTKEGSQINFHCTVGYVLEGANSTECTSKGWTKTLPKCVIALPTLTLDANNTYTAGSTMALKCSVEKNLKATITWTKDKIVLLANERIQITTEPYTLLLHNATMDDAGTYSCIAKISGSNFTSEKIVTIGSDKPDCTDNPYFANCQLIVKANFCHHRYFNKSCCKSCSQTDELPKQYIELSLIHTDGICDYNGNSTFN